jgi:ATP-binding cassette subfamily B protein
MSRTVADAVGLVWRAAPRELSLSIVLQVVAAAALAVTLLAGRNVIEVLTSSTALTTTDLLPSTLMMGLALVVSGVTQVAAAETRMLVAERTVRATQAEIADIATSVDYERFESAEFHDLLDRANTQAVSSAYKIVSDLLNLVSVAVMSAAVVAVLVTTVPAVLLGLVVVGLPFLWAARASALLAYRAQRDLTSSDRLRSYLYRALTAKSSAQEVRVFALAGPLRTRWTGLYQKRLDRLNALTRRRLLVNGLGALAASALVATVLILLVAAAASGRVSLADAAVAIVALQQLAVRARVAANASGSVRGSALYLRDFERLQAMRGPGAPPLAPSPLAPEPLSVEHVSFRYPATEPLVLHDVSLTLTPGEIVALVGVSGSGKTTLANLVAGLYRPTAGRITYGGVDIGDVDPSAYRRSLGVVFQDFERYELTAHENIAISDERRLDDRVAAAAAAKRAGIAEHIAALPQGFETMLSRGYEGGADLSVGQWQRIALARAFFRDAPVLVLDEPAASLDPLAEQALVEHLRVLAAGRAVLMISHRFSTVRMADRIAVIADGHIVEAGTHAELLAQGGRYADLFMVQAKGYLPDEAS